MMHAGLPPLITVEQPAFDAISRLWLSPSRHVCRIRTMAGFSQAKRHSELALQTQRYQFFLLLLIAKVHKHDDVWKIPDHRVLSLQVVEQTQSLRRQMLPYHRHPEVTASSIGAVLTTVLLRQGQAVETSFIREFS